MDSMDNLFFILSKLAWLLIAPDALFLLMLVAGVLFLARGRRRIGRILTGLSVLFFLLVAMLPLEEWAAAPLERRFPANPALPPSVDGIIVLGGSLLSDESTAWEQPEINATGERLFAFARLARVFPEARLVFSGGSGQLTDQETREADLAAGFFQGLGLDTARITFERQSRNTWENVINSQDLVSPRPGERWVLITSAAHMPRAVGIFCQRGWPVLPYPVDHNTSPERRLGVEFAFSDNLVLLKDSVREWVGLAAYYVTGKTPALLPRGCPPIPTAAP